MQLDFFDLLLDYEYIAFALLNFATLTLRRGLPGGWLCRGSFKLARTELAARRGLLLLSLGLLRALSRLLRRLLSVRGWWRVGRGAFELGGGLPVPPRGRGLFAFGGGG